MAEKLEGKERLIEKYSKKWGISYEEAEKRLEALLERKNTVPGPSNIFPEPLGPLSQKTQDISQAILTNQITRRMLTAPPEDVATLHEKVMTLNDSLSNFAQKIEAQINQITNVLDETKKKEAQEQLSKYLDEKLKSIREEIKVLSDTVVGKTAQAGNLPPGSLGDAGTLLNTLKAQVDSSKGLLSELGFKVEKESLSREDVQKMIDEAKTNAIENLPPDELQKKIEARGFKVVGGPIPYEKAVELIQKSYEKGKEEGIESQQVQHVVGLIKYGMDKMFDVFTPGLKSLIEWQLTGGGAQSKPQPEPSGSEAKQQ
jgi:DNA repair exonuclease SbcCD ATPase subunit